MSNLDIIRAWKDETFRASLSDITLPENPAGQIELTDTLLHEVQGGLLPGPTQVIDCTWGTWTSCEPSLILSTC